MKRTLIQIDSSKLSIGRDAALRFRWRLPGDEGESAADAELVASVRQYGLIDPPILYGKASVVVCGHRRIAAALHAGIERIDAFVMNEESATKDEIASLWLEDVRYGAELSDLERIILTVKCREFLAEGFKASFDQLEVAVGKSLSDDYLDSIGKLLDLPEEILDSLHDGKLSTGDLLSLGTVDRDRAARIIAGSGLGRKDRREAVRTMLRLQDLGAEAWGYFIEDYEKSGGPLLEVLRAAAFPSLDNDLDRIDEIVKSIGLPQGAAIHPPENLEGGSYGMSTRIRDEHSFDLLLSKLRRALDDGKIKQLLDILKGKQKR